MQRRLFLKGLGAAGAVMPAGVYVVHSPRLIAPTTDLALPEHGIVLATDAEPMRAATFEGWLTACTITHEPFGCVHLSVELFTEKADTIGGDFINRLSFDGPIRLHVETGNMT